MPGLLAHGLFALAAFSVTWAPWSGDPLSAYGFLAAVVALLPDAGLRRGCGPSVYGHSAGYAVLWLLVGTAGVGGVAVLGLLPETSFVPLWLALALGLGTHWFLDILGPPGLLLGPGREPVTVLPEAHRGRVDTAVCVLSLTVLVLLTALL